MESALHFKTKVLPGGKIQLDLPQATEGEDVDVFVIISSKKLPKSSSSVLDILEEIYQHRTHGRTATEIDQELQSERDAWDN